MKIMIIVGTRPEIIRLSTTIRRLQEFNELILVHTGQNYDYELNHIFFKDLDLPDPHHYLDAVGESLAETLGRIITRSDEIMALEKPDAVLILGDTNSSLSVIPAKRRKIPVFHYEAGNRCFDDRVPEEINRRIVDHTADMNLTYSQIAKQNLLNEGLPIDRIMNIGSPVMDVYEFYKKRIDSSDILDKLGLKDGKYFVLSAHREENVDDELRLVRLIESVESAVCEYGYPVVFSVHPRTRRKLEQFIPDIDERMVCLKPLGYTDYVALQRSACCVLSDSGTITEESSVIGFPAINIRETHERLEGMEYAAVVMAGIGKERIAQAIRLTVNAPRNSGVPEAYRQTGIAERIHRIIVSYVDYINRTVWSKKDGTD